MVIKVNIELTGAVKLNSISDIKPTSRLFYELGYYTSIYPPRVWVRTGVFREIHDVMDFINREPRLADKDFIEHHNYVIIN